MFEEVRIPLPAGTAGISFSHDFYNSESANFGACPFYNDGMEIVLVDAAGNRIATLVYEDAFSAVAPAQCTHSTGAGGGNAPFDSNSDGPEFFAAAFGSPTVAGDYISIVVWNGGDNAFQSIAAIDDVQLLTISANYETNTSTAALNIDNVLGTPSVPAVVNKVAISCPGSSIPATGTVNFSSLNNPGVNFDIIVSMQNGPVTSNLVPQSGGAPVLPNGEIVNLNIASTLTSANGPGLLNLRPLAPLPGATGGSFTLNFSIGSPADFSIQGVVTNASAPGGFELTQPVEAHVTVSMHTCRTKSKRKSGGDYVGVWQGLRCEDPCYDSL